LLKVVKALCGVNAQLPSAMELSLQARVEGLSIEDIETSMVADRTIVRTWCMRGTMHLLHAEDLDWLLSTIAPGVIRAGWRWLEKRAGLSHERSEKVLEAAYQTLRANGPMTRRELMAAVSEKHGAEVKPAAAGVVHLNGLLGRVCFGPHHGADPTYVATDDWLGRKLKVSQKPEHLKLVRRYLQGYAPAEPRDLAAWWGFALKEAKAAWDLLKEELVELDVEGASVWLLGSQLSSLTGAKRQTQSVRLLPAFDTYLLGYQNRDFAVPPGYQDRIFHGGEIVPTIMVDGCAEGTWRYERRGKQIRITVTPFSSFTTEVRDRIVEEADDIGRFYGLTANLSMTKSD
jgi:hypothetical protein